MRIEHSNEEILFSIKKIHYLLRLYIIRFNYMFTFPFKYQYWHLICEYIIWTSAYSYDTNNQYTRDTGDAKDAGES